MQRFFPLVSLIFASYSIGKDLNRNANFECPSFNYLQYFLWMQCPVSVGIDLRCVIGLPGDRRIRGHLNCVTVEDNKNVSLRHLEPSEMLELIRYKDIYGRPWCMLSLLYSPECVFSAKVAESVFSVAKFFPKLRVIAVDVSKNLHGSERLITQFGIASTPVITLWENGFAMFQLNDESKNLETLIKFISSKTDLKAIRLNLTQSENLDSQNESCAAETTLITKKIKNTTTKKLAHDYPSKEQFLDKFSYLKEDLGFDRYFLMASIALLFNITYFVASSEKARYFLRRIFFQQIEINT